MTKDQIIRAICDSQRLEDAGPPVIGIIKDERFALTGVIREGLTCKQTLVSIATKDRQRLKSVLHWRKSQRLGQWTERKRKLYQGFYIPIDWLDSVELEEAKENGYNRWDDKSGGVIYVPPQRG